MKQATGIEIAAMRKGMTKSHERESDCVIADMRRRHAEEEKILMAKCENATGHKWENITDQQDQYCGIRRFQCKWCHRMKSTASKQSARNSTTTTRAATA
jgi:hypothetical protein